MYLRADEDIVIWEVTVISVPEMETFKACLKCKAKVETLLQDATPMMDAQSLGRFTLRVSITERAGHSVASRSRVCHCNGEWGHVHCYPSIQLVEELVWRQCCLIPVYSLKHL